MADGRQSRTPPTGHTHLPWGPWEPRAALAPKTQCLWWCDEGTRLPRPRLTHCHSAGDKFLGPSPGSSSNPTFMTLVGKDPICNAAMSRLPLVSPPCTHKTRSYQRIEPSGEASGRWEPSSPRTKERSQERAQRCVHWTKPARGQPGSLASGRGRVHRGRGTPGGAWEAALNVLEVLGRSQPRTTRKCSASLSREKPASWGRSEGR